MVFIICQSLNRLTKIEELLFLEFVYARRGRGFGGKIQK